MAVKCVVVEVHLGVESDQPAVASYHEWIDLGERGIGFDKGAIERLQKRHCGLRLLGTEPKAEGELPRDVWLQADGRPDRFAQDGRGIFLGDFFDFHASGGARHYYRSLD